MKSMEKFMVLNDMMFCANQNSTDVPLFVNKLSLR